ncbi:MAG: zinc-dependent alcohol dehydrogenase [Phycisphaerae bacterium]
MRALVYDIKPAGWLACRLLRRFRPNVLTSPLNGLTLRDIDPPGLPGDDWVRVRTLLGGICGTDLALLAQKQPPDSILQAFSSMPMLLGHENLAEVIETGPAVEDAWVGRRVCVEPTLGCVARGIDPVCEPCSRGQFGACENFGADGQGRYSLPPGTSTGYNSRTGGSYGEQFVAHVSQLVPVPDEVPDEVAILTDPLACSLHSVLRADLTEARRVLVYGAGVLGLGCIAALRALGFEGEIHALDRADYLGEKATALGADRFLKLPPDAKGRFTRIAELTGATQQVVRFGNRMLSGGYDVLLDCVGSPGAMQECLKWAAARGQIVVVGTGSGGRVDWTPLWFRELTLHGAYGRSIEQVEGRRIGTYSLVLEWLASGRLAPSGLLTHTFALEDYREALKISMNKASHGAVKVAFDFRSLGEARTITTGERHG